MLRSTIKLLLLLFTTVPLVTRAGSGQLYTSDRLSSSTVNCVLQDAYGYIWISTEYGLNRFDGYSFTRYIHDATDTTSIVSNEVNTLFRDSRGRLWAGCSKGLMQFDYRRNCFRRYAFPGGQQPRVQSLNEFSDGTLLIATAGYGLYILPKDGGKIRRDDAFKPGRMDDYASETFIDARGDLWLCNHMSAVTRVSAGRRHSLINPEAPLSFRNYSCSSGPAVRFLPFGRQGFLIVCLHGIMQYDYRSGSVTTAPYDMSALGADVSIRCALQNHRGDLVIGTSGRGLMVIRKGSNRLEPLAASDPAFDLGTANVNDIFEDKNHNLWVSCYKKGLYRLSGGSPSFTGSTFTAQRYYLGSSISSIAAGPQGSFYVTVQKSGVYHFDRSGLITGHPTAPSGPNTIYHDTRGDYWLCTENTLFSYNPATGKADAMARYEGWGLNCITDDGRGNYYMAAFGNGLVIFNKATRHSETISMRQNKRRGGTLCNDWIKALFIDRQGLLWAGTAEGICCMDTRTKSFNTIRGGILLRELQGLSFAQTRRGQILIGTNAGLYAYDPVKRRLFRPAGTQALRNNSVYSIVEDLRGDLWMSTAAGIWQYDRRRCRLIGHVRGNGLTDKEYIAGAVVHGSDDRITFATNDGITSFYPQQVRSGHTEMDSVFMTDIQVDGRTLCPFDGEYTVRHDENTILLEYSLLNYISTDEITFQYKINDAGRWLSLPEGTNTVTLNKLEPGTYQIHVRAVSNGVASKHIRTTGITVLSPWYASTPAFLVYIMLFAAAVIMGFRMYERRRKEELDEAKMRFLINATHDIRSPLTLIVEPLKRLKACLKDVEAKSYIDTIDRNAQKLLLLVNSILDQRRIDKNQMHLHCQPTSLPEYISAACAMFRYNARQHNIILRVEHSGGMPEAWIDRVNFDKVMQNLLSNAFKFTPDGGEITVSISCNNKVFNIDVTDTGCSFGTNDTSKLFDRFMQGTVKGGKRYEGTGIGLNLSRTLVLMHGGKISAFNRKDGRQGAVLHIELPVGNAHLKPEEIMTGEQDDTPQTAAPKRQASKNCRVLVVDDDAELAEYIRSELSDWYRVDCFGNGQEALDALLKGGYDLVVSDVMMPVMDGITLLKKIKSNSIVSDIPVILLTSKADVSDRLEGIRKGADAYMAKPFDMNELRAVADNLISNVRRLRGKFTGAQKQADKVEEIQMKGNNDALMDRIMKVLNDNIGDPDFNVEKLSADVGISRAQLHRKMKEITGISTGEFIRNLKFEQAARLIRRGDINITQVAYAVGFNNSTHFSTVFKKHFGVSPSEYADKHSGEEKSTTVNDK